MIFGIVVLLFMIFALLFNLHLEGILTIVFLIGAGLFILGVIIDKMNK